MQRSSIAARIARVERKWGLSASERDRLARLRRFRAALAAYRTERDRIAAALPPGWRLVMDFLVADGGVVDTRHRATNQPPEIDNGVSISTASRRVTDVHVRNAGLGSIRPVSESDANWLAEGDRALSEDLRRAVRALVPVDFIDYLNGKKF